MICVSNFIKFHINFETLEVSLKIIRVDFELRQYMILKIVFYVNSSKSDHPKYTAL